MFFTSLLTFILAMTSSPPSSSTGKPITQPPPGASGSKPTKSTPLPLPEVNTRLITSIYGAPGVVALKNGDWVGNENLYHLRQHIAVVIEVVKPTKFPTSLSDTSIKEKILAVFKQEGILVKDSIIGDSPLPFFHFLIMLQPIEQGIAAYCSGRLFEAVQLNRIQLPGDVSFQAITWEKQELLITPNNSFDAQIAKTAQEFALVFAKRLKSYGANPSYENEFR